MLLLYINNIIISATSRAFPSLFLFILRAV